MFTMTEEMRSKTDPNPPVFIWKINTETGSIQKIPFDGGYHGYPEGHHSWIIGIDRANYLHIIGDMHNGSEKKGTRYENNTALYWRSKKPMELEVEFLGNVPGLCIPTQQITYAGFTYSNTGQLWLSCRIRNFHGSREKWFSAMGLYSYHENSRTWQAIGGYPPISDGYTRFFFIVESGGQTQYTYWYQGGKAGLSFDLNGDLHWCVAWKDDKDANVPESWDYYNNRLVYARSSDNGTTWTNVTKDRTMSLPLNTSVGDKSIETIDKSPIGKFGRLGEPATVFADKYGRPAVFVRPIAGNEGPAALRELVEYQGMAVEDAKKLLTSTTGEPQWYYYHDGSKWTRSQIRPSRYHILVQGLTTPDGVLTFVSGASSGLSQVLSSNDMNNVLRSLKIGGTGTPSLDKTEWYNPLHAKRTIAKYTNAYKRVLDTRYIPPPGKAPRYVNFTDQVTVAWEFE